MVFSSVEFLFAFFPVTLVVYYLLPGITAKNIWLIVASILFYAYGEPVAVWLLLASCLMNYLFGRLVARKSGRKWFLALAVLMNIGIMAVFKYSAFAVRTFNSITGLHIGVPDIPFPIGISFYTFQALSYVIDVYRDPGSVQKNPYKLFLYILLFPQLIAGPIVKYHDIADQITSRTHTLAGAARGLRRFMVGLSKKVLIANTLAVAVDAIYAMPAEQVSAPAAWLAAVCYALQIYYDFSGYSDMAIGIGAAAGFHFKENFRYPYVADSVRNFWRRWHISLSTWFKEYLYIPLGGNRKGRWRTLVNKMIVFFCTGLWHGANWTFVLWGLFHGLFSMLEQSGILPIEKIKFRPIRQLYTCLVAVCGFVIFRADTLTQAGHMLASMFTGFSFNLEQKSALLPLLVPSLLLALLAGLIFSMPVLPKLRQLADGRPVLSAVSYIAAFVLMGCCFLRLSTGTYNPFIYFQF